MNKATIFPLNCDCGDTIEACVSCEAPRCATCEPYVSDDCVVVFAAAS
jgi:hypothetical protein